jgi:hypothetical protein
MTDVAIVSDLVLSSRRSNRVSAAIMRKQWFVSRSNNSLEPAAGARCFYKSDDFLEVVT